MTANERYMLHLQNGLAAIAGVLLLTAPVLLAGFGIIGN